MSWLARPDFLNGLAGSYAVSRRTHKMPELDAIAEEFEGLRSRLEALQELFAPLLSEEDTAPAERLRVRPLVQQVVRSMRPLVPRVEFDLRGISSSLRFPLGLVCRLERHIAERHRQCLERDARSREGGNCL